MLSWTMIQNIKVHNMYTEGACPTPVRPAQTHCINYDGAFPYTLVYSWIKLTPGKCTENVNKQHQVKVSYFKPIHL